MKTSTTFYTPCNYPFPLNTAPTTMSNDLRDILRTVCLITEGRTPLHQLSNERRNSRLMKAVNPFYDEGPHCKPPAIPPGGPEEHICTPNPLCRTFKSITQAVEKYIATGGFAVEVYFSLTASKNQPMFILHPAPEDILIEAWHFDLKPKTKSKNIKLDFFNALRSSLHFSQLASWFVSFKGMLPAEVVYRVCHLDDINQDTNSLKLSSPALPILELQDLELTVSNKMFPRVDVIPLPGYLLRKEERSEQPSCELSSQKSRKKSEGLKGEPSHQGASSSPSKSDVLQLMQKKKKKEKMDLMKKEHLESQSCALKEPVPLVDDRMKISCDMSGKHHCRAEEEMEALTNEKPIRRRSFSRERPPMLSSFAKDQSMLKINEDRPILHGKFKQVQEEDVIAPKPSRLISSKTVETIQTEGDVGGAAAILAPDKAQPVSDSETNPFMAAILRSLDKTPVQTGTRTLGVNTDISFANFSISDQLVPEFLVNRLSTSGELKDDDIGNSSELRYGHRSICAGGDRPSVPSAKDQMKFRRSLDSATQLIFHRDQGLPPLYPSTVHRCFLPVKWLRIDEAEPEGAAVPTSPGATPDLHVFQKLRPLLPLPILGSFEESVLHGRLEPVKTVQGFTAEIGANGSFIPEHRHPPVTVFFYSICENDKVSTPYLAHLNLGDKGYNVPRAGTIQVTLFNPLKTVVKMFVLPYDLSDMPPNCCTFLRQRLLYMPVGCQKDPGTSRSDCAKYSRYLIHLRLSTSKSGKLYLHTDIRILIFRKSDADTVVEMMAGNTEAFELRAQTYGPTDPKYSNK